MSIAGAASAQTPGWSQPFGSAYTGGIYVSPQDSSFAAPAIYRSFGPPAAMGEMAVSRICTHDFRDIEALKSLYREQSTAPGVTIDAPKTFGASLTGLDLKVAQVGGQYESANSAKLSTGQLKVYSADDTVASDVLKAIGSGCRDLIAKHLKAGRAVFIAGQAIQAKEFKVAFVKGKKGSITVKCLLPLFCPSGSLSGDRQFNESRSTADYVTFMLVPAEIDTNRVMLTRRDVGR
ncbi:hypothetical protein [Ancylobacter amanitiformis]|uniref:Uncharacterized protein n=1 Tax=Ancylobacter amanitiformis TaxID=217069 RepID=A0ABU0LLE4_9HYPH|nr:hypothetical protein [Ancylobacter amanitiformis]MDQ0509493.1 hypothetical protein [Ancylobacter amanitiformis]